MNYTGVEHHDFVLAHAITRSRRIGKERANHKYIKREWNNGRWAYTYKDDTSNRGNNRNAPKNGSFEITKNASSPTSFKRPISNNAQKKLSTEKKNKLHRNRENNSLLTEKDYKNQQMLSEIALPDYEILNKEYPTGDGFEYLRYVDLTSDTLTIGKKVVYPNGDTRNIYRRSYNNDDDMMNTSYKRAIEILKKYRLIDKAERSKKNVVKSKGTTSTSARASSKLTTISQK